MAQAVCSYDRRRHSEKLASAYWAWFDQDGERHAYRVRYCLQHGQDVLLPLLRNMNDALDGIDPAEACCVACGGLIPGGSVDLYAVLYFPKREPLRAVLPFCDGCHTPYFLDIEAVGEPMPDRPREALRDPSEDGWVTTYLVNPFLGGPGAA